MSFNKNFQNTVEALTDQDFQDALLRIKAQGSLRNGSLGPRRSMENSFEKKSLDSSLDMSKERIKKGILLHSPLSQSTKTNLRKGGSDLKVNFEWDQVKIKKPT